MNTKTRFVCIERLLLQTTPKNLRMYKDRLWTRSGTRETYNCYHWKEKSKSELSDKVDHLFLDILFIA